MNSNNSNWVNIAFITDEGFLMPTTVAVNSLIRSKNPDSLYDIRIIASDCSDEKVNHLLQYNSKDIRVSVIKADTRKYSEIKQLAHITPACLLKFDLCDMLSDCDKILYIDGDVYIKGDLSELYNIDIGDAYVGGVKSLEMLYFEQKNKLTNAGVFLFNAEKMRKDCMSESLIKMRRDLGDCGSMDQKVFNLMLGDEIVSIPYRYNCVAGMILASKRLFTIERLNSLYDTDYPNVKAFLEDAVIIHYASGGKPWKYSFVYYAREWYECYKTTIYGEEVLNRKGKFSVRIRVFFDAIRKEGFSGLNKRVAHYINQMLGKSDGNFWG